MEEKTERGMNGHPDRAVIVAGGFCDTEALGADPGMKTLFGSAFVIAADSGLTAAERMGLEPDLIVGDFDSYTGELPEGPGAPEIVRVPAEKDVTDTVLACEIAMERGYRRLTILGGTGGRADHSLSNILYLYALKNKGIDASLTDGRNEFRVLRDEAVRIPKSDSAEGGEWYFSLFALGFAAGERCAVRALGCKYPLPNPTPLDWSNPSYAVSNEVTADCAVVSAEGTVLLVRSRK